MERESEGPITEARRDLTDLLSREGPFRLAEAALLVAAEDYPELDLDWHLKRLDAMGVESERRVVGLSNPFERLSRLHAYLFDDLGFKGNADHFDDPRNSFLNEVLDRRLGIPLTLSIVYIEVARRAGFRVRGVGLPGHFVIRVDDGDRSVLVDPFHGGEIITEDDCRDLVARTTGRPSLFRRDLLDGTTERSMLCRLLLNLKRIYLVREDYGRALSVVERLLLLAPEDPEEIRDRGFLKAHLGRPGAAFADLEAYLTMAPEAPDAESVRGRLAWLARKMSEIH